MCKLINLRHLCVNFLFVLFQIRNLKTPLSPLPDLLPSLQQPFIWFHALNRGNRLQQISPAFLAFFKVFVVILKCIKVLVIFIWWQTIFVLKITDACILIKHVQFFVVSRTQQSFLSARNQNHVTVTLLIGPLVMSDDLLRTIVVLSATI